MRFNEILENKDFIKALKEIKELEKDRTFCGHGLEHLFDVARTAYIISLENSLKIDKDVIYAAALLHDIGRGEEYKNGTPHNAAGAEIAKKILDKTSYTAEEIRAVLSAITLHRSPNGDKELEEIIYMADKLTRNCGICGALKECNRSEDKKNYKMRY